MEEVYELVMTDNEASYDGHEESFTIGFFSDRSLAEKTAERYLSEVEGFREYDVSYRIERKRVVGDAGSTVPTLLYIIYGWNENEAYDETDVIESDCYTDECEAVKRLDELKAVCTRKEWCIDRFRLNECHREEGFVKL